MAFEIAAIATVMAAYGTGVVLWPTVVKPALQRRYVKEHLRRKAGRR